MQVFFSETNSEKWKRSFTTYDLRRNKQTSNLFLCNLHIYISIVTNIRWILQNYLLMIHQLYFNKKIIFDPINKWVNISPPLMDNKYKHLGYIYINQLKWEFNLRFLMMSWINITYNKGIVNISSIHSRPGESNNLTFCSSKNINTNVSSLK